MKLLFTSFCCFASLMASDAINCDNIKNNKTLLNESSNLDYLNIASSCKESLKNQDFTKKLYAISNEIRGSNSSCNGVAYLPKLQQFDFLLLKIAIDPIAYQKTLDTPENLEKKYDILKSYFRYWAYQSIGNFRLYKAFWQEYNNAIEPLEKYFESNFNFDKGSNIYYTSNALNEFLNWAVGETKIYKDISPLAKVLSNKKHSITYIQDFIYTNNLNRDELTIGLQAALLNQRNKDILNLLIRLGARIDEGYENALFYALENYDNTKFLLELGLNVNSANTFGKTPLFYAIEFKRKDIVSLLLEYGTDVNKKYINDNEKLALSANIGGNTPYFITFCALEHTSKNVLMHAAAYGDVEILKMLVAKGADINEIDDLGFNALDFALAANQKDNANYLQSLGLKPNENLIYGGSLE
ncbi:ankyrin repeat domain-containing protein [Campylobacter coli]|uniref:ankyrin repeat domain-containing protein n=1 Tax=Campylobacter coli TaxID=195 RepID=UPI00069AF3E5|nr:ankyrin repeat domain-containing protein [Campylobacter coli]EAC1578111.1 ankyrin repeat domain-containing protein [Campylobacter coli]EAH4787212.1 ankyrin repeat domain-containing protein [Campylobacter coli]EAH5522075.1 ankyrin repeat domain-containing protein [Campylobacter coli]EAH5746147.1 ankyrin repeat domain-containing protein [Campylobacter coli]EAH6507938.1 ankyrin repeat domain-containing protein [Campylobacter coli]